MKVFMIDDDRDELEIMTEAVSAVMPGIKAEVCEDPEQAINLLKDANQTPDFIVLDNIMHKMNGLEVIQKLQKLPNLKSTKIVVLSNHISPKDEATMKSLGIEVFQKGFNFKSIIDSLRKIIFGDSTEEPTVAYPEIDE